MYSESMTKNMHIFAAAALSLSALTAPAQSIEVTGQSVESTGENLLVRGAVCLAEPVLKSRQAVVVTPYISFGADTVYAPSPLIFAGRSRHIQYERHPRALGSALLFSPSDTADFTFMVPVEDAAMLEGTAGYKVASSGCCNLAAPLPSPAALAYDFVVREVPFAPEFVFVTPEAEENKIRSLSGRAFVDFRVNRTEIDPFYRANPRELAAIHATIDSVRRGSDVTVKAISFTGYASPEGSYANNTRLAQGRTAALRDYVRSLYDFSGVSMEANSVPEDWEGLQRAVEAGNLAQKEEILAVITDTSLSPDARDRRLAQRFPAQYRILLADVYPALRHCDYTIEYEVRAYDDPAEILRVLHTAPQNLSLREMFVAASTLEPGSDEFCTVFEIAARLFPTSETANLNAAVSEMQRGDLARAAHFLERAGNSDQTRYARGILKALGGDKEGAVEILRTLPDYPEAVRALQMLGTPAE